MADEYNWSAYEVVGTWTALAGASLGGIIRWLRGQRRAILAQVETLRASHERHVKVMTDAHLENSNRFVKLEAYVANTEDRLDELVDMMKELRSILLNMKQGRR